MEDIESLESDFAYLDENVEEIREEQSIHSDCLDTLIEDVTALKEKSTTRTVWKTLCISFILFILIACFIYALAIDDHQKQISNLSVELQDVRQMSLQCNL
jgi:uncharacterized membrane-anchored protein YhcB (DUF1043 family)